MRLLRKLKLSARMCMIKLIIKLMRLVIKKVVNVRKLNVEKSIVSASTQVLSVPSCASAKIASTRKMISSNSLTKSKIPGKHQAAKIKRGNMQNRKVILTKKKNLNLLFQKRAGQEINRVREYKNHKKM